MDRRKFIRKSSLITGGIFASSPLFPFIKSSPKTKSDFSGKVIIVGAGSAGLYAGFLLKSKGIDYEILEASDSIGGRLQKLDGFADFPLDLGAQWLHGKKSILGDLIKRSKTKITKDKSDTVYWYKNKIVNSLPLNFADYVNDLDILPDISYQKIGKRNDFSEDYKYIIEALAGDYGADASELSVKWTAKEEEDWSSGNSDFKFKETFFDLINIHFAEKVIDKVKFDTVVNKIDYQKEKIILKDNKNTEYLADKVIITVPITILQAGDIEFTPTFQKSKIRAFNKIGMGPGMKVFLKFKKEFYHENIIGGTVCAAYANEKIGKVGKDNVLMAFIMGEQAEHLSSLKNDEAVTLALVRELDEMYDGKASRYLIDSHVQDWTRSPFIKGAYSFSKVGIGNSRKTAAAPINDKIYFAGEAMNLSGHHQTVHGALESGARAVSHILKK